VKVTLHRMDLAEIRCVQKVFIKERGVEVFRKICQFPIFEAVRAL
jgi:hypothetical protein